jgi:hypothetical protein
LLQTFYITSERPEKDLVDESPVFAVADDNFLHIKFNIMLKWLSLVISIRETGVRIKAKAAISSYPTTPRLPLESRRSLMH